MPLQSDNRRLQVFRRLWPHFLIVSAALIYLLLGGYLFYLIETRWAISPFENNDPNSQNSLKKSKELGGWTCPSGDTVTKVHDASKACKAWSQSSNGTIPQDPSTQQHSMKQEQTAAECEEALAKLVDCLQRRPQGKVSDRYYGTVMGNRPGSPGVQEWSWSTGIILAFTIVTTIGYGQVTPQTSAGRMFCIIYGIFGIPLVLLALANQGRFFSAWLLWSYKAIKRLIRWIRHRRKRKFTTKSPNTKTTSKPLPDDATSLASSEEAPEQTIPASVLLCVISAYLALGGYFIQQWEAEGHWSFIDSTYFVFTSASSIGFGDLVPTNRSRMALTFLYICLGLALTTTAIDIFGEYLRRLHYWGAKIKNAASTFVWFGGNKVTINQLVRTIGHELGASEDKIKTIVRHLDSVINMAIQEAAEQQEVVEAADLQYVENFIPATNERVLVHQNSCEFGIAEASLLSPLIFAPPDQHQVVVANNNDGMKRPSLVSMKSMHSSENSSARRPSRLMRWSTTIHEPEQIHFIDGSLGNLSSNLHRPTISRTSVQYSLQNVSPSAATSPREIVSSRQ